MQNASAIIVQNAISSECSVTANRTINEQASLCEILRLFYVFVFRKQSKT